jgi:hypothetical protein
VRVRHPTAERLEGALSVALGNGPVEVLRREENVHSSTFATEVVSCRIDNETLELFCKYGPTEHESSFGHRGGIGFEADVYRQVLVPVRATAPRLYGVHDDETAGTTWLFLEYLRSAMRVSKWGDPGAMEGAARWIGSFHRRFEHRTPRLSRRQLTLHDVDYYRGWSRRTLRFADTEKFPWLGRLCSRFERLVAPRLATQPLTVVHGEFTVHNVLATPRAVHPVDWQSAGVGVGETDLVALTEGWVDDISRRCEREYAAARWGDSPPCDFTETLQLARVYHEFRWLGEEHWRDEGEPRFDALQEAADELGLL